jgi:tellurite resistance-related uncharacterized protein
MKKESVVTMSYPNELQVWADKIGEPVKDLQQRYTDEIADVKKNHPEMSDEGSKNRALKILYSKIKADMRSRAEAFDFIPMGVTSKRDMNQRKKEDFLAKYANVATRDEALTGTDGVRVKVMINQETGEEKPIVVDDREWIEFQRDGKDAKFKNRGFGKELAETNVRDIIAIGKRSGTSEGWRILRINAMRSLADSWPTLGAQLKTKFNVRKEDELTVDVRAAEVTQWNNVISIPGMPDATTEEGMYKLLGSLPDWLKTSLGSEDLKDYHEVNKEDYSRVALVEGDITYVGHDANENGSHMVVFEDESSFDIEAEGIQGYVGKELKDWIQFSPGTHVRALVRTGEGNVRDRESGELVTTTNDKGEKVNVKRVIFSVLGIVADPDSKVPYTPAEDEAEEVPQS